MSRSRPIVLVAVLAALSGCGVTTGGTPEELPPSDVPYGLLSPTPTTEAPPSVPPTGSQPRVYLVSADDVLVATGRDVDGAGSRARLADLLAQLSAGPRSAERSTSFRSVPPTIRSRD